MAEIELAAAGIVGCMFGMMGLLTKGIMLSLESTLTTTVSELPAPSSPSARLLASRVILAGSVVEPPPTTPSTSGVRFRLAPLPSKEDNGSSTSEQQSSPPQGGGALAQLRSLALSIMQPLNTSINGTSSSSSSSSSANTVIVMMDNRHTVDDSPLPGGVGVLPNLLQPMSWFARETEPPSDPRNLHLLQPQTRTSVYGELRPMQLTSGDFAWVMSPKDTIFTSQLNESIEEARQRLIASKTPMLYGAVGLSVLAAVYCALSSLQIASKTASGTTTQRVIGNYHIAYTLHPRAEYWIFDIEVQKTAPGNDFQPNAPRCYLSVGEATQYLLSSRILSTEMICVRSQETPHASVLLQYMLWRGKEKPSARVARYIGSFLYWAGIVTAGVGIGLSCAALAL